jgi:predicted TIM-barrel fold metal-dependent hydrolase
LQRRATILTLNRSAAARGRLSRSCLCRIKPNVEKNLAMSATNSSSNISRRELLAAGLVTSAAAALSLDIATATAAEQPRGEWIDAHSHVWSPDVKKWPLANGQTAADLDPPSFTPEELLALANPVGVGRVVLIQHHTYHGWDNSYLIDCAAQRPGTFAVVGMIDDTLPHPDVEMKRLLDKRVRGFRITPRIRQEKWLTGPGMAAMWKMGAETGQAMCCLLDAADLPAVDDMCRRNPQTPVVIDHFARIGADGTIADKDVAALCKLARHKHTYVKASAYYALGKKQAPYDDLLPMLRRVLDAYGPERVMWASDAPYQVVGGHTYPDSINFIRQRADFLTDSDRSHLLLKTAHKIFFS